MIATHKRLLAEIERQKAMADANAVMPGDEKPKATNSRRKRERETRRHEELVRKALEDRKVEDEIKGLKMEKVYSKRSTKQVMIARASVLYYCSETRLTLSTAPTCSGTSSTAIIVFWSSSQEPVSSRLSRIPRHRPFHNLWSAQHRTHSTHLSTRYSHFHPC